MKTVTLNGARMTSKEAAHRYLAARLGFPDYYGCNLDALWDVLSTMSDPVRVRLINKNRLVYGLGSYGKELLKVFADAARENANLSFEISDGSLGSCT